MSQFGVLVMGPAGSGKTTFCHALIEYLQLLRRPWFYVNLDPAAPQTERQRDEEIDSAIKGTALEAELAAGIRRSKADVDIRRLVRAERIQESHGLGPNGALHFCIELLAQKSEWLTRKLAAASPNALVIFDLPGQVELFTHAPALPSLVKSLSLRGGSGGNSVSGAGAGMRLCAVFLLDAAPLCIKSHDLNLAQARFMAGALAAMSAMLLLELPHINLFTKMDLVKGKSARKFLRQLLHMDGARQRFNDDLTNFDEVIIDEYYNSDESGVSDSWDDEDDARHEFSEEDDDTVNFHLRQTVDRFDINQDPLLTNRNLSCVDLGEDDKYKSGSKSEENTAENLNDQEWLFAEKKFTQQRIRLNSAVAQLLTDFGMLSFINFSAHRPSTVERVLGQIDTVLQFYDEQEPHEPRDYDEDEQAA